MTKASSKLTYAKFLSIGSRVTKLLIERVKTGGGVGEVDLEPLKTLLGAWLMLSYSILVKRDPQLSEEIPSEGSKETQQL